MARRKKRGKSVPAAPIPEPPSDDTAAVDATEATADVDVTQPNPPDDAPTESAPTEQGEPGVMVEFDQATSDRILSACGSIFSTARIAANEATASTAPFLSFAQKSRVAGLATDFETRRMTTIVESAPSAAPQTAPVVEAGESLTREEVDKIVSHRIEIAVHEALQQLGVSPDATISHQVERQVEIQLSSQEHRLLEYVKRHLTDSLEMLESTLDERVADLLDGGLDEEGDEDTKAEVDAAVEEAREALLKNIDEVRTVETGWQLTDMDLSDIAQINDRVSSGAIAAIADEDIAVAAGADEDEEEVALGDGDGDGDDEVEAAADDEEEVEAAADDEEEVEAAADDEEEVVAVADDAPTEAQTEVVEDDVVLAVADAAGGDAEVDSGDAVLELGDDEGAVQDEDAEDFQIETVDDEVDDEVDEIELDSGVEEISVIEAFSDAAADDDDSDDIELETADLLEAPEEDDEVSEEDSVALADALEVELDEDEDGDSEDEALLTLGSGPEDLVVAPVDDPDEDIQVEVDADPGEDEQTADDMDAVDDEAAIERYLQRASEMSNRKQAGAAMELYSKVIDIDAQNYEARIGRGVLHLEGKDYKRAVDEFTEAEKIDPSRSASAFGLAEVHFQRKQFNKAIRHYTQCLKLDDEFAAAYCNRGLSYYYQKNYKKAFLDLMRAYDLDPGLPNIKKYLKLVRNKVKTNKSTPGTQSPK